MMIGTPRDVTSLLSKWSSAGRTEFVDCVDE